MKRKQKELSGTFVLNKGEAIHRWFSYMEGYSNSLVEHELNQIGYENIESLYDPFGGSGTSLLTASEHNIKPYYSEVNPVMAYICQTKINSVFNMKKDKKKIEILLEHYNKIKDMEFSEDNLDNYQGFEKFYDKEKLNELLEILSVIKTIDDDDVKNITKVCLASITVQVSKMIRRGDLRYAKDKEKEKVNQNVKEVYLLKLKEFIEDIKDDSVNIKKKVVRLADDARDISEIDKFDCVITSPPYLNGTNYIRNTKLELKLLEFVSTEKDLPLLHSKGIIAGINSVSKRSVIKVLPCVETYIKELLPVAYDKRIPKMVAGYFYDMNNVFKRLSKAIKPQGKFIMDIGDSQFCGVHIPTHEILEEIAASHGFIKYSEDILRTRHSNNGFKLSQRVLRFTNNKQH